MKRKLLTFGTAALFLIGASFITSCGDSQNADNQEEHEHMDGENHENMSAEEHENMDETKMENMENMENTDQTAAVYACPMHSEITGKEGENCSKCGMPLEKTEQEDHSGHDHE